jgi:hypothetical protein
MPDDFIPLVRTLKPKVPEGPTPLDDRFQHLSVLDRRQDGNRITTQAADSVRPIPVLSGPIGFVIL